MKRQIEPLLITEESPAYKRISWWIENTLVRVIKIVTVAVSTPIRKILSYALSDFLEDYEKELIPLIKPFVDEMESIPGIPENIKKMLRQSISGSGQVEVILLGIVVAMITAMASQGIAGPMGRKVENYVEYVLRSKLLDPGTLLELSKRGIITKEQAKTTMAYNGMDNASIVNYMQLATPLLDDTTLTQLMWRKEIGTPALDHELSKRGMNAAQIILWKQIREVIPSPSELISIAVREGFNDTVAARFGYDEDYPTIAADYAERQGMAPKFFKAAWRAHWTLPGLVQVREMYHRDIINIEDVRVYLKAADLPTFWRTAIIKWMDRVVTRVDARRMYDLGIWDEARVFDHHKELGYGDKDAEDLTMWVALNYMSDDRELTKTDILSMYQDGILTEAESTTYLVSLDYKPQAITLLLAHRDLKRDEQYEKQIISNVRALFVGGLYDRTDVLAKLGKIGTPSAVIKQNLAVWDLEKERKVAVPTTTQLRDMVLKEVITVDTFKTEMRNKKYPDKYINWYLKLWIGE